MNLAGGQRRAGVAAADASTKPNLLRELNEQAVLATIFREGPITRPEIATRTSLSKPTVSAAVRRLEQSRLVHATGERPGRRGRKPMAYVVSDRTGFVVGIDIGGTNLRVGAADIYGQFLVEEQQPTTREGARAVSAQVMDMLSKISVLAGPSHGGLLALGVSTPGVVDRASRRVTSLACNVSPDGGFDPLETIGRRFDVPVLVDNDVNLAAVGEKWAGLARGVSDFVFVSVGAGVGMGIVIGDDLVCGADGAAGEIAYLPSAQDPFGQHHHVHGALEDEIGAAGVLAAFRERDQGANEAESAHEVFELARAGNTAAQAVVEHVARRLGSAIATVCAVLNPALVVLGGGIGANQMLLSPVRATVAALVPVTVRIETTQLAEKAALHGAIAVALRQARGLVFSGDRGQGNGAAVTRAPHRLGAMT